MYSLIRCYYLSVNKEIYRSIAREFNTTAIHVYRLAHGKKSKGISDYRI